MNLQELYSLSLGQKITQPYIMEKYFPLPFDNYITFQPWSKPVKNYDNWGEVLFLLKPILEKHNIQIVQVGGKDELPLPFCHHTQGQTNWGQLAYLIKNSKLHFGSDSIGQHIAGYYNVPLVDLVVNNYKTSVEPYFGSKDKQIILEPKRPAGHKPNFVLDGENPKSVNTIYPEIIVSSICKLLNIQFDYEFKTFEIGSQYNQRIIESLPNQVVDIRNLGIPNLILRADYFFDEPNIFNQLNCAKCIVVTDRPINPQILQTTRPNILEVFYHLKEAYTPSLDFCKTLQQLKIPLKLFSFMSEEKLNNYKLDFMDLGVIFKKHAMIPEKLDKNNVEKYFIKSNRFILSNKQVFSSYYTFKNNMPLPGLIATPQQLIKENIESLGIDGEYLMFLEKV